MAKFRLTDNKGQVVKELLLSDKQKRALLSEARFLLLSGGFRAGKTLVAIMRLLGFHAQTPNNRILVGRLTYPELRDTVQKDIMNFLPAYWIDRYVESKGNLYLKNGTEIMFRHLDAVSEMELRGMTLGCALVDQVEEISESVIRTVASRLNLPHVPRHQIIMTSNPEMFWAYRFFKQEKGDDRELIEFSLLDNKQNLPEAYVKDMLTRPENWKKQYVYGIWDESLLSDRAVMPIEYIIEQRKFQTHPKRYLDGIQIFQDVKEGVDYQAGVDVSEGLGKDFSALSIVDTSTGEQVAFWKGQIQPDLLTNKILPVLRYFNEAMVIPEINGIGMAFLTRLKEKYSNIYKREVFDRENDIETEVLGWKTTTATKPLLVDNFIKLCREGQMMIRAREVCDEMATFVYSDEAKKKGMGANEGYHDDALIATMLSYYGIDPRTHKSHGSVNLNTDKLLGAGRGGW